MTDSDPYKMPPSWKNVQMSMAFAAVVLVGRSPPDHLTALPKAKGLPAVASFTVIKENVNTSPRGAAGKLENVRVVAAAIVTLKKVARSTNCKSIEVAAVDAVMTRLVSLAN